MKSATSKVREVFVAIAFVLASAAVSWSSNGTWNGTADAYWTNSANWSDSPYPSGGDTATFSGASDIVTVNLAGLAGILNITFDTPGVAAYTLGAGAPNSQTAILRDTGEIKLTSTAGSSQVVSGAVQLGLDRGAAPYYVRNDNPGQLLTFNNVSAPASAGTQGTKSLTVNGAGSIAILGNLMRSGASNLTVTNNCAGVLTLSGSNIISTLTINSGTVDLGGGYLFLDNSGGNVFNAYKDTSISGTGKIRVSTSTGINYGDWYAAPGKTVVINPSVVSSGGFELWSGTGTFVLNGMNDFASNILFGAAGTISASAIGNQGSTASNLGRGQRILLNASGCKLAYTGSGETSDRILELNQSATLDHAGTGTLLFTSDLTVGGNVKTLTLAGTNSGTGEISGTIGAGTGTTSIAKTGTNTWRLSGNNTYSGSITVNGGSLVLSGANATTAAISVNTGTLVLTGAGGAISSSAAVTVGPGCLLLLDNTAAANNSDRLSDSGTLYLNGATLAFAHDSGAADFSETAGTVSANQSQSIITTAQAAEGQTSTLTFTLGHGAGTLDFVGVGLGESERNRIFLAGQPDGLIGLWATVNGTNYAAYSSTLGVYAAGPLSYTDIAARGPDSVIPDDAAAHVRINSPGDDGFITLATSPVSSIYTLLQNTNIPAVVTTTNTLFKTSAIRIGTGMEALTIGATSGDGALSALTAGGDLLLENNSESATLTINAPIDNNASASSLTKTGPGAVRLTGRLSYTGPTAITDGALTVSDGGATQILAGVISGTGALTKSGSGRLTLSGANTFAGVTTLEAGTLQANNNACFGSAVSGVVIEAGATLDVAAPTLVANTLDLGDETFTVSGDGVNGRGAIINSTNTTYYGYLNKVSLAGDTTFGGEHALARWDIRKNRSPVTPTLLMNDHAITKVGSNTVGFTSINVTPGAGSIDLREGSLTLESATTMGGSAANTLTVRGGTVLDFYSLTNPVAWSLTMEDNTRFYARAGNTTSLNIWAGPVTLQGRAVFDAAGTFSDTVSGDISGPGGSVVKTTANSTTYFTSPNNTYGGTTTISNGTLYAKHPGSLPGYGAVTVTSGGRLIVPQATGAYGWTSDQINTLHSSATFTAVDAVLGIETAPPGLDHLYNFPVPMGLHKHGNGTLTIPQNQSLRGQVRVNGGELVLNNLAINVTNQACSLSDAATDNSRLTVSNNASWSSYLAPDNNASPILYVGNAGRAVLTIDNSTLTNRFIIGNAAGSHGAVYQRGASSHVHNWCGRASDARMGENGYCYYELSGGTLTNNGHIQYGRQPSGVGILAQYGGRMQHGTPFQGDMQLSRGGTGVVYLAGGTFACSAGLSVGYANDNTSTRGFAEFTMAPSANTAYLGGNLTMADRTNMLAVVNLNGGRLTANMISKGNRSGAIACVNFDGGTFAARISGNLFNTGANAPDYVNIYDGGATFDTATNIFATVPASLRAPAGSGLSSIALTPRAGYIGPPFLTIAGGGGTGATAFAQFDSANGTVTGATITSPGFGYTSNPTVTLAGGGSNVQTTVGAITRTANVSGGLTKTGPGTLTLSGTNTYAGATTVSNGILRLAFREAFPAGRDINVHGGTLDLNGSAISNGTLTVSSGAVLNGWLNGGLTKVGDGTALLSASLSSATPVSVAGGTLQLAPAAPGLYEGRLTDRYNTTNTNPQTAITLSTRYANQRFGPTSADSGGIWVDYSTYAYSGFLWNNSGTNAVWSFAKSFDDGTSLKIDGVTVIDNYSASTPVVATYTLTPGPHFLDLRVGQATGWIGPNAISNIWTTTAMGVGFDPQATLKTYQPGLSATHLPFADPGDGSLLTTTGVRSNLLDAASAVEIAPGATLDLGGNTQSLATLHGGGLVSNGTLVVTGTLAPGGTNTLGTLTAATTLTLTGTLLFDIGPAGAADQLTVLGNVSLEPSSSLVVANPAQLNRQIQYTVLTCTGTRSGSFGSVVAPDSRWRVLYRSDGSAKLVFVDGVVLKLR